MTRKRTRICECCGNTFTTYLNEIRRGRGMFCCRSCAKKLNYQHKAECICPTCHGTYSTYNGAPYCCEECRAYNIKV